MTAIGSCDDASLVAQIRWELQHKGYWVDEAPWGPEDVDAHLLKMARALGQLYVPEGCSPDAPIIRTVPNRRKSAAPFDRPEPIGWHGDFASHNTRPDLSFVYVTRADPAGGSAGGWRLAGVKDVLAAIGQTRGGGDLLERLATEPVPFSYREGQPPRWLPIVRSNGGAWDGLRFYEPSIRRGYLALRENMPVWIAEAMRQIREAADKVCVQYPTTAGSLLVADNWRSLHDRTLQTLARPGVAREALLLFATT